MVIEWKRNKMTTGMTAGVLILRRESAKGEALRQTEEQHAVLQNIVNEKIKKLTILSDNRRMLYLNEVNWCWSCVMELYHGVV